MKNFSRFLFSAMTLMAAVFVCPNAMADTYNQQFTYQAFTYKLDTSKKTAQLVQDPDYKGYVTVSIPRVITYKNEEYTVNNIGSNAFKDCANIKEFTIPYSITYINTSAFYGCSGVTKVTMDAAISMSSSIFADMKNLEEVQLSILSKTKSLGTHTFSGLKKLKTFKSYSSALTKIDDDAFSGCTSLEEASFYAAEITSIGNYAFHNCTSLKNLYFQKKTIGGIWTNAFENCTSLKCDFSDMPLKTISNFAFYNCNLTSFAFPATLQTLGKTAFANNNLTSIDLSNTQVTTLSEGVFSDNPQLTSIILPVKLNAIEAQAFANDKALSSLNFSNTALTIIKSQAFKNCTSLTRLTFPTTLTSISDAFDGCNALKQVICNAITAPGINTADLFPNCTTTANDRLLILTNGSKTSSYYYNEWDKYFKIASPVPTAIKLSDTSVTLWAGTSTHTLTTTMTPVIANNMVTWTTSNDAVATVSNGVITPKSVGTCTITVTTSNDLKATCNVTVQDVSSVTLNTTTLRIQKGSSTQIHATVAPATACQDVTWESSDKYVASVNSGGVITAQSKGTCTISAYSWNKKKVATCRVTVTQPEIGLDYYSQLLKPGESATLKATAPSSDYMSFNWSSSNTSVATVDSWGFVKAISEGTTLITCSPKSGTLSSITAPAKCVVTVSNNDYIYVGNIYYMPIEGEPTHLKVTNMGLEIESSYKVDADRNEYSATVTIPDVIPYKGTNYTVTQIGKYAFYRMKDLQMVVVPNTVEIIDEHAFERSEKMVRVSFATGSKLHTINQSAFKKCSLLNYVVLPNTVKNVGISIFEDCVGMSDLTLSTGMTYVSDRMCYNCDVLDNLVLPDGIITIGKKAFMNCDELNKITYSQNLTLIDEYAFSQCKSLKTVTLPAKMAAIQDYAYMGCDNLTNMVTPASLEGIGAQCFNACPALANITLKPAKPITIGESAFYDCGLKKVTISDLAIWAQCNFANKFSNPLTVAQHLYSGTTEITDANIPATTTYINQYAFSGGRSIKSVTIPASVNIVSDHIFKDCDALTKVTISNANPPLFVGTRNTREAIDFFATNNVNIVVPDAALKTYQNHPYWGLFTLNGVASTKEKPEFWDDGILVSRRNVMLKPGEEYKIEIMEGLSSSDISFSSNNSSVASVNSSGKITAGTTGTAVIRLEQRNKSSHYKTIFVTVSEITPTYVGSIYYTPTERKTMSVTGMGYGNDPYYPTETSRYEYSGIVNLPATVTYGKTYNVDEIERYALYCMRHLQKTIIPASVTTIGDRAFEESKYMQRVEFGTGSVLSRMDERAFYRCKTLDKVALPNGLYLIDKSTFRYCENLKTITLPSKLSMIDEYGFANCVSLKNITLPASLASIQNYCFAFDDVLADITIPTSMVGIGAYCFRDCKSLQSIRFSNTKAMTIGESAFYNCNALKTTYVDKIDRYVETNFFNEMANPTYFSKFIGQNNQELKVVVVPSTATFINQFALVNCKNVTRVDLPASIITVSDHIFLGCSSLNKVISRATVPPAFIGTREPEDMFATIGGGSTIFDRATLFVQASAMPKYQKDGYWKLYHRIADLSTVDLGDVNGDGLINATDVVSIYNFIINGEKSGISRTRANVNGDDQVNTSDVIAVYNIIIGSN